MIEINNVSFRYSGGTENSIEDISLRINDGECVVLTGESGCGKTTVTRLINLLIPGFYEGQMKGEVIIDGVNINILEPHHLSEKVGSVFQNPRSQFFSLDSDSEIVFGMENAGISRDEMRRRYSDVVENLGISKLCGRKLFKMSGGEKQMVAFASVCTLKPSIYVLDEPTANLDMEAVEELRKLISKEKERGKTIIISEHRVCFLRDIADRVIVMDKGRIKNDFRMSELKTMEKEEYKKLGIRSLDPETINVPVLRRLPKASLISKKTDDNTIEVRNLKIGYEPGRPVLDKISFAAEPGEIIGIIGRNGCGKSTMARTLSGLMKELGGNISCRGGTPYMVMQDADYQLFSDSVIEELKRTDKGHDSEAVRHVMDDLGLDAYKERHPMSLSGGQKQRIAIGVASLMDREVIIFDEPTSGLDYKNMERVALILKRLSEKGKTILLISHDHELINKVCDYIYPLGRTDYL